MRFPEFKDEWQQTTLGEVGEIRMCKRILANQTNKEGGVPFFKIGTIGKKEDSYISETLFQEYKSKYHYPNKGQILITCAGTIGRCIIFDGSDAYYQDSNIVWIDNEESQITNPYLFYLLNRTDWSRLNTSTIVRLYNDDLRALPIPLPSLPEQKKIASFLSLLDERIEAQRQTIKERKNQKKALLSQIFSQALRFPGFSDEWQQTTLGESHSLTMGQSPASSNYNDRGLGLPLIQGNADMNAGKTIIRLYTTEITKEALKDDIIMSVRAPVGALAITSFRCCIGRGVCAIRANKFVYYCLQGYSKEWSKYSAGSTFDSITGESLRSLPISLPSMEEQKKIAELFTIFDERIEVEEALLACYERQKRYLLRQMFV